MVRSAEARKRKYESKIDADVVRSRISAQKTYMVEQMESRAAELATIEANVKAIVESQTTPISSIMVPFYLNAARELYKLSKKFSGTTLNKEADVVLDKWCARGLTGTVLQEIAGLFGISWTPPGP